MGLFVISVIGNTDKPSLTMSGRLYLYLACASTKTDEASSKEGKYF